MPPQRFSQLKPVDMLSLEAPGSTNGMFSRAGWFVVLLAIAVMYGPTYWAAAESTWQSEDNAHGALVLAVVLWLFWRQRVVISESPTNPASALGGVSFALGLLFYVYGRTLESRSFEFLSPAFVVAGLLMVMKGRAALAAAWFPIFYLLFTIPLPAVLIDTLTGPLKQWISVIVERALHWFGYPISRAGVVIHIGPYQLLVADACSGLHSMFSMIVIGSLYVYLRRYSSRIHNMILLTLVLPLAFVTNIIRVTLLVLITYYLGDEAGQGILHGTVGLMLMLFSLIFLFGLDQTFGPQMQRSGQK